MMIQFGDYKYLNTDQITHILPNKYLRSVSDVHLTSGDYVSVKNNILNNILKNFKIEGIE